MSGVSAAGPGCGCAALVLCRMEGGTELWTFSGGTQSAHELFAFIWTPKQEKFPQITPKLAVGRAAAKSFQAVVVARVYEKV